MKKSKSLWVLYILQCADGTLYTGITNNLERRLDAHKAGHGAKYTRGRAPLKLVYNEVQKTHSAALIREQAVKKLTKQQKLALIKSAKQFLNNTV